MVLLMMILAQDREGVAADQQLLILGAQQLQDERTLLQYNIGMDSVLHLGLRCRYIDKKQCVSASSEG